VTNLLLVLSLALVLQTPQQGGFKPEVGQQGKDSVWVPTSPALTEKMLDLARVTVIAAARRGARALGVELNPEMVKLAQQLAAEAGVSDRATFVQGDMFEADISKATVLALFLMPANLERLEPKFRALRPGTRIVVNTFGIPNWTPDATEVLTENCTSWCTAMLYKIPPQAK
jgi:SAM-dependent methyltransferase